MRKFLQLRSVLMLSHAINKNGNGCSYIKFVLHIKKKSVLSLEQASLWEDLHVLPGELTTNILDTSVE